MFAKKKITAPYVHPLFKYLCTAQTSKRTLICFIINSKLKNPFEYLFSKRTQAQNPRQEVRKQLASLYKVNCEPNNNICSQQKWKKQAEANLRTNEEQKHKN